MITFLIIEHISGGNLFYRFVKIISFCKDKMDMIIRLSFVMMAVSYTHLDVYKRQIFNCLLRMGKHYHHILFVMICLETL